MAICKIVTFPDPILREIADPIDLTDVFFLYSGEYEGMVRNMQDTLHQEQHGAALAANQIGIKKQIFVIKPSLAQGNNVPSVIINPKIVRKGALLVTEVEGCLSFPHVRASITRPKKVEVECSTQTGTKMILNLSGFIARVFQHEIDHLNGVLFLDHTEKKDA